MGKNIKERTSQKFLRPLKGGGGRKLLRVLIFCVALAALSTLHSQLSTVSAQHYIGGKVGYGAMSGRIYPKPETSSMVWNRFSGGVAWKYYSPQQVVGGFSIELEYQMRGFQVNYEPANATSSYTRITRTVNTITMPIIWQPHLYFAQQRVRLFVNLGFTVSYNLGIGDKLTEYTHIYDKNTGAVTETTTVTPYKMNNARDMRFNYGVCFGLGTSVVVAGPFELFVEGRYYLGMSDILRTKTRYIFNTMGGTGTIRSELDNIYINVGFFFRFGRGGITEKPLQWKRVRRGGVGGFDNIKLDGMRY